MNVFISPHLDDAILSCGGLIARLAERGAHPRIITLCTADAPLQALSPLARAIHAEWGLGDQPYPARRQEDVAACALIGAEHVHCGLEDAIYRCDAAGHSLYTTTAALLSGQVHPYDWAEHLPRIKAALRPLLRTARVVYCPLSLGGHVDHVLARSAVEATVDEDTTLVYYEDFPYAIAFSDVAAQPCAAGLVAIPQPLREAELDQRIRAIACYSSQLPALFGKADRMSEQVRAYVARVGGERYWTSLDAYRMEA